MPTQSAEHTNLGFLKGISSLPAELRGILWSTSTMEDNLVELMGSVIIMSVS